MLGALTSSPPVPAQKRPDPATLVFNAKILTVSSSDGALKQFDWLVFNQSSGLIESVGVKVAADEEQPQRSVQKSGGDDVGGSYYGAADQFRTRGGPGGHLRTQPAGFVADATDPGTAPLGLPRSLTSLVAYPSRRSHKQVGGSLSSSEII